MLKSVNNNTDIGRKLKENSVALRESILNVWDAILQENQQTVHELYESFCVPSTRESVDGQNGERKIGFQNIYLFFREIFYADAGKTLYLDRYEEIDFFSQENSFKSFLKETSKIVKDIRGQDFSDGKKKFYRQFILN